LQGTVDAYQYRDYNFVFNQFTGLHVQIVNFLSQQHPIRNRRDIENYLVRLKAVAGKMDTGIVQARGAGKGILMPTFITQASIGQLDRFLDGTPESNVFVASLVQRMANVKEVSAEDQAKFTADATAIVKQSIIPVFQRTRTLLQEQLPHTNNDAGLWRLPNGDKAYAVVLRQMTSTDYTPQQIHEIGQLEVARIEKEMNGLLVSIGYTEGSIKERMAKLEKDQQPKEADPRPQLLARYDDHARCRGARQRPVRPRAESAGGVKREPLFTEKTAAAHYTGPAKDGTRPGIFWAPLPGPDFRIVGMRTLVYHEAVPGHHFQVALQQENTGLRAIAATACLASARRMAKAGRCMPSSWRRRMAGMAMTWWASGPAGCGTVPRPPPGGGHRPARDGTRQQGIDYGIPPAEVDRYVVMPGQACAYKIGMMRILDLRQSAESAGRQVQHQSLPQHRPRNRQRPAVRAGKSRGRVDRYAEGLIRQRCLVCETVRRGVVGLPHALGGNSRLKV
jgi:uncharacterized protein (DUF885 family)